MHFGPCARTIGTRREGVVAKNAHWVFITPTSKQFDSLQVSFSQEKSERIFFFFVKRLFLWSVKEAKCAFCLVFRDVLGMKQREVCEKKERKLAFSLMKTHHHKEERKERDRDRKIAECFSSM